MVTHLAPRLLAKRGVGPINAAQAIVSWSHPGRCRNDAAHAALAGASPIPASTGRIVRHRLNRGGDRISTAPSGHPSDSLAHMPEPGPTSPGAAQKARPIPKSAAASKRYIAWELYRSLNTAMAT